MIVDVHVQKTVVIIRIHTLLFIRAQKMFGVMNVTEKNVKFVVQLVIVIYRGYVMRDGEITKDKRARFCVSCNREHGVLYVCTEYDQELQDKITQEGIRFRERCLSGEIEITSGAQTKTWNDWVKDGDL